MYFYRRKRNTNRIHTHVKLKLFPHPFPPIDFLSICRYSVDLCISMHSTWFQGAFAQTVGKNLVRMCWDSRCACVPSLLEACMATRWTCHRDRSLHSQKQNRDTIDSSSSPYKLFSSRPEPHASIQIGGVNKNTNKMAIPSGRLSQIARRPVFVQLSCFFFWCFF